MIWFGCVLWHINHDRLFNVKSFLYIYINMIWFDFFYGISTSVGIKPNPLTLSLSIYIYIYIYILNIHDLVWLCFIAYQPLQVI